MIWFLGVLFVYCGMLVRAPAFTIKVSALMGGILYGLWLLAGLAP